MTHLPKPVPMSDKCNCDAEDEERSRRAIEALTTANRPEVRAAGRFLQAIHPAINRYLDAESNRGTPTHIMIDAVIKGIMVEVSRIVMSCACEDHQIAALTALKRDVSRRMDRTIEHVKKGHLTGELRK